MRKNLVKHLSVMLAAAMVFGLAQAPAMSVTALAATKNEDKDYTVTDAWWSDDFGSATAEWEKAEDSTKYKVKLYKGTSSKVLKDVSTSSDHYDFSSIVSQKGTGKYYFTVTPVKGTADDGATSDILEVDSDTMSDIKAYLKDKKKEATSGSGSGSGSAAGPGAAGGPGASGPRWVMNPNGTWKYLRADGTYSKNTWELVDGKWYYFGGDNLMMTGWQKINGSWFYLMPSGEAFGPGWFQDTAGGNLWYYFDGDCRMLTGTINVNGVNYFMNDGSVASLPVGAWVQ